MSTEIIDQPTTEHATLQLGGESFAASVEARKTAAPAKPEEKKPGIVPAKPEDKKPDTAEKKDEPEKDAPKPGKTPLDVAPPEKKDIVPPVEEEIATLLKSELPPNASESTKVNNAAMRKGLERANATIQALRTDLQTAQSKTSAVPAEIEERLTKAEAAVKDRDALIERVAFERSPRYQKFITESDAELNAAKSYLEGTDINPNVIDLAAKTPGAKRVALLTESGMEPNVISAVLSNLARNDAINRDRDAAQENWKVTHAEWNQEQKQAREAKESREEESKLKIFKAVGEKLAKELAPLQRTEDNKEWNSGVDTLFSTALEFYEGKRPFEETYGLIYEGLAGRVYKQAFEDLRTKHNDTVAELGRVTAAKPGAPNGATDTTIVTPSADPLKDAAASFEAARAKRNS